VKQNFVLTVEHATVALDKRRVIDDLSFAVAKGDVLTIVGPNGAGKTVLLKALLGLLPHSGNIEWDPKVRIGYVPQRLAYMKEIPMTVSDFLDLKGRGDGMIRETLRSVGLKDDLFDTRMSVLSSGQFQSVLIAWSLLGNPSVLLLDEPTTGIDLAGEETVHALLERLHRERGLTLLLVTHDLSIVYSLSTYVLCLNRHLVCHGPPTEVLTTESLRHLYGADIKYYSHTHN
jgi:zinc transport system ATP-binding protein